MLGVNPPLGNRTLGGCGCGGSCGCGPTLSGLGAASTLTPQQALDQAKANASNLNPADWNNPTFVNTVLGYIQSGQISASNFSPACAGVNTASPDLALTQTATSLASTGIAGGALIDAMSTGASVASVAAAPLTLGISLGIAAVSAIISAIFSHHAQAAHQEQQLGCVAIAGFNNAMNVISQAVQSGVASPAVAVNALGNVFQQFQSTIAPSYSTSPFCSADCELQIQVQATVLYWQAQYAAAAAAQQPSSTASTSTAAPTTTSSGGAAVASIPSNWPAAMQAAGYGAADIFVFGQVGALSPSLAASQWTAILAMTVTPLQLLAQAQPGPGMGADWTTQMQNAGYSAADISTFGQVGQINPALANAEWPAILAQTVTPAGLLSLANAAPTLPASAGGSTSSSTAVAVATASVPSQPGSGSAGAGPVAAAPVSSGSVLQIPSLSSIEADIAAAPSWLWMAAAGLAALVLIKKL